MHRRSQASTYSIRTFGGVAMIIEEELRHEIERAIRGEVSLHALYEWVMSRSWNMHKDSSAQAVELASHVESLFFENPDEPVVLHGLKALLASAIEHQVFAIDGPPDDAVIVPHSAASEWQLFPDRDPQSPVFVLQRV